MVLEQMDGLGKDTQDLSNSLHVVFGSRQQLIDPHSECTAWRSNC